MGQNVIKSFPTFDDFLRDLFDEELSNESLYDPGVVAIIKEQIGQETIPSRAGNLMADALIRLAKERSNEVSK